jgi:putative glutamine amidotransferase
MSTRRPLIGITADIEYREGNPGRDWYFLDAQNIPALVAAGALPVMLPHDETLIDDWLDRIDGVLISGGGFQFPTEQLIDFAAIHELPPEKVARTRFELALARRSGERQIPLFGVCGGFQLMNVVAGGTIAPQLADIDPAWSGHRDGKRFDEAAHEVQVEPGTRLAAITGAARFPVNSRHSQGVIAAASGLRIAARSLDGVIEAIERPGDQFWLATQWHPEFGISPADAAILAAFVDAARE